jgi:hypothetical protein
MEFHRKQVRYQAILTTVKGILDVQEYLFENLYLKNSAKA